MADLSTVQRTKFQPDNLRAPESTIKDYKKITPEDYKDLDRQEYTVFAARLRTDPVRVMLEASDLGMSLEQYSVICALLIRLLTKSVLLFRVSWKRTGFSRKIPFYPRLHLLINSWTTVTDKRFCIQSLTRLGMVLHSTQRAPSIQLPTSSTARHTSEHGNFWNASSDCCRGCSESG